MLYSLLGGGVMLGALFMATDYATSPAPARGPIGLRRGVRRADRAVPLLRALSGGGHLRHSADERLRLGAGQGPAAGALRRCERRKGRMNVKALIKPVAVLAAVFVLLLALSAGLAPTAAENAAAEQARLFDTLLPGGAPFTEEAYNGEDTAIAAVHRGSTGYIVETVTAGYAGDITMLVAVDFDGAVVGAVVAGDGGDLRPWGGSPVRRRLSLPAHLEPGRAGRRGQRGRPHRRHRHLQGGGQGGQLRLRLCHRRGRQLQRNRVGRLSHAREIYPEYRPGRRGGLGLPGGGSLPRLPVRRRAPCRGPARGGGLLPAGLAAEAYLSKGVPRRNWGLTLLLGALTFGLLPWAAGLTAGTEAVRFAVVGGAAFGALTFLFTSLRERLASGPSGRLAPLVTAGILFLACQCFAGMLL